ncbi:phosphoglycerate mutase-like protein [Dothidotthia symphoricarpi CBS 119687]|uniref:Phosphoglycerate mutase-like protein n=1 Tax=Dothidotthia symphoricarpi CBS 119687 TaxID=1392245 RepID=A0A6A6AUX5_9PLEO|nr:phosphoglycerate mutase-like protein [Dothidotthia symphoricarpi CBS 119687]KAF2134341.1 phosphoglycerate mutase-like protein [Dothidotthia symphoricarpi CBS 119687]
MTPPLIHLIRHGESLHNIHPNHPHPDPPLTKRGHHTTKHTTLPTPPDLILISPLTRTLQTAVNMFPSLLTTPPQIPVQIWPSLCETHNTSPCNTGSPRAALQTAFPSLDFSTCPETWDFPPHTHADATARAERVRAELLRLSQTYHSIAVVTHRGFKEYLVKGRRFGLGEVRSYRFATLEEGREEGVRWGVDGETGAVRDFGPTVLVLWG